MHSATIQTRYVRDVVFRNISFSWEKILKKSFLLHVNQVMRGLGIGGGVSLHHTLATGL